MKSHPKPKSNTAKITIFFVGVIILFLVGVFALDHYNRARPIGAPFTLTDSNGQVVTQEIIREKPAAIFFGYTMCPEVCPTTLVDLQHWLEQLGPEASELGVWFFTVDPERDTPKVMHDFLRNFSDKIVGISGDPEEVKKAVESYNIVVQKVPGDYDGYDFNHTSAVILLHKGGAVADLIPYQPNIGSQEQNDNIAVEKLRNLIKKQ